MCRFGPNFLYTKTSKNDIYCAEIGITRNLLDKRKKYFQL